MFSKKRKENGILTIMFCMKRFVYVDINIAFEEFKLEMQKYCGKSLSNRSKDFSYHRGAPY